MTRRSVNGITAGTTIYVYDLLRWHPDGQCRRDFAQRDIYEVSARIGELKRAGITISTRPCTRHTHRKGSGIVEYRLGTWPE